MNWFSKSPFRRGEDVETHMVELLARAADDAGSPLTDIDKEILKRTFSPLDPVPPILLEKTRQLIKGILRGEALDEPERDLKSFGNSLQWVDDYRYSNIVAITVEVASEWRQPGPPLHGWQLTKDRTQLIGCGVLVVLLMFAIGIAVHLLFGWN
jgi:hypothetical protein